MRRVFRRGPVTYTYTFTGSGDPGQLMGPGLLPGMPPTMGGFQGDAAGGPGSMDLTNLQARAHPAQSHLSSRHVRCKRTNPCGPHQVVSEKIRTGFPLVFALVARPVSAARHKCCAQHAARRLCSSASCMMNC